MEKIPKRFWEDDKWAHAHLGDFQEKYMEKWVAVCNKKVVAVAKGPITARKIAQKKTGLKEIPVVFVESGQNIYSN
jgi:hypothetical protein